MAQGLQVRRSIMARRYALVVGVIYVVVALISLLPAFSTRPADFPPLRLDVSYGLFLGLFAQNIVNKLALLAFGVAGIAVATTGTRDQAEERSVLYARAVFAIMGLAAILGFSPATWTFFGLWPLWGNEVLLHAANALLGAYFGFRRARHGGYDRETSGLPTR